MFFEDMFSDMGGFPGHGCSQNNEPVDTEGLYKILGVSKSATVKEIKTAFRKAALKHHPDRGGDAEKFKEVEKAKEILLDPKKRNLYDKYGEKGVERGGTAGGGDLFDLFTGGGGRRQRSGPPKPKTITQTIDITLEDVFKGSAIKRKWKIKSATKRVNCSRCDGQGAVRHIVRQGPMMLQTQKACDRCSGRGFKLPDEKLIQKSGTVHIPHGIKSSEKITLAGEGHNLPEYQDGDITFIVRVLKHKIYTRTGADLGYQHTLTLHEALCGYKLRLKHVSGKTLIIKSKSGEVVQPGELKVLHDFGLPQKGNHFVHGHLYIIFKVVFPLPASVPNDKMSIVESVLKDAEYPDVVPKIEIGLGSRVRIKLPPPATEKIYGKRHKMTAYGIIAGEMRNNESWPVEFDQKDGDEESKLVIVPVAWIKLVKEDAGSSTNTKKRRRSKEKGSKSRKAGEKNSEEESEDEFEDVEEVFLETVVGDPPKPTPAQGGSAHDEDEEEQNDGSRCQQM